RLIAEALAATGGNLQQAAKLLGLPRQTLQYRLAKWEGVNVRQKGETGR
ncbi:helix-turn-helix domain-containing protein, partial [Calditerricola satsumensis]